MAIRSNRASNAPTQTSRTARQRRSHESREGGRLRFAWRLLLIGGLGLATSGLSGCSLLTNSCGRMFETDCIDDFMLGYRNRAMAEKAWHCRRHAICDQRYAKEFKDGFIQGYINVASGGNGCTPVIAPSNYWGWRYQSAGGHQAINAWFQGFPQGAKAAEEDGVGHWQSMRLYRPAHHQSPYGAAAAPAGAAVGETLKTAPQIEDPFYPESSVPGEVVPAPIPEPQDPLQIEPFEALPGSAEPDSVFDALFPPVAVSDDAGSGSPAAEPGSPAAGSADAVLAERSAGDSDDAAGDIDGNDDPLPFRFE